MTLLRGPLGSTDARGTLAGLLTFSNRRGRHVAGIATAPKQPRTLAQRATRIWLTWLSKQWNTNSPVEKATFQPPAQASNLSPYHAFLRYNLTRLQGLPDRYVSIAGYDYFPTRSYEPPTMVGYDGITSVSTTGLVNAFSHRITVTYLSFGWFFSWHILDGGRTGVTYSGTIHVQPPLPLGTHDILIENITPGFHEFVFGPVSTSGHPRVNYFKRSVTVL